MNYIAGNYDVAIIGAGVVGGMVARTLAKYDIKLCIVDKENDVAMGTTKANSAIVHAGFDAKEGSLKAIGTLEELRSLTGEEKLEEIFLKIYANPVENKSH